MLIMRKEYAETGLFNWLTPIRRAFFAGLFVGLAAGLAIANGHTTQGAIQNVNQQLEQTKAALNTAEKKDIPALKAQAGCEKWRGDVNGDLATKPVMVNPAAVQADNCPHPQIILPPIATK